MSRSISAFLKMAVARVLTLSALGRQHARILGIDRSPIAINELDASDTTPIDIRVPLVDEAWDIGCLFAEDDNGAVRNIRNI